MQQNVRSASVYSLPLPVNKPKASALRIPHSKLSNPHQEGDAPLGVAGD